MSDETKKKIRETATKQASWPIIKGFGPAPSAREVAEWRRQAAEGSEFAMQLLARWQKAKGGIDE